MTLRTEFLLLAQYGGKSVIPIADVCRDFFSHLSPEQFVRNCNEGRIAIPVMRLGETQKAARGVHLNHLAAYLDERAAEAEKETKALRRV